VAWGRQWHCCPGAGVRGVQLPTNHASDGLANLSHKNGQQVLAALGKDAERLSLSPPESRPHCISLRQQAAAPRAAACRGRGGRRSSPLIGQSTIDSGYHCCVPHRFPLPQTGEGRSLLTAAPNSRWCSIWSFASFVCRARRLLRGRLSLLWSWPSPRNGRSHRCLVAGVFEPPHPGKRRGGSDENDAG